MGILKPKQNKFYKVLSDTLGYGNDVQKIASINALQDMFKLNLKIKDIFNDPHTSNRVKEAATQFFQQAGDFHDIDALYDEISNNPDSINKRYIDAIEDILQRYYDQKTFSINIQPQHLLTNMINTDSHIIKYTTLSIMKHLNLDDYYLTLQDLLDSEKLENTNLVVEILKNTGNIRSLLPLLKLMENITFLSKEQADFESGGDRSKNNILTLGDLDQSISQYRVFEHKQELYDKVLENIDYALDKISSKSLADANLIEEAFINALSSEHPLIRSTAAKVLGNLESNRSVGVLISLLRDTDESVIESAIEALGNIKNTFVSS
ncbi:MAG: HEAT repeat domain-containing protein [Dehalococcoides mccartyi]|uniref:HEAT repeat domain-containing protein n=1 Tax=Dehalococcoides TaxID=61434 RepID=UPI002737E72E|nr:HEAT repeat domain-containing protein [Dehalococcoides mccartyi]MDP4280318.1 HEAT repeat domain-containing protein [Dehalococcoides mccartyi]